jgi:hypothetical protein
MAGIPEILLSWTKQEWRTSRERLHREDHPCHRNPVLEASEPGPSTRVFNQLREREVRNGGLCFARSETSCDLGCRRGSSHPSSLPFYTSLNKLSLKKINKFENKLSRSILKKHMRLTSFLLVIFLIWDIP